MNETPNRALDLSVLLETIYPYYVDASSAVHTYIGQYGGILYISYHDFYYTITTNRDPDTITFIGIPSPQNPISPIT